MFAMHDIGWGWEFLMGIGMIALWALIVFGVIWLVRSGSDASTQASPRPPTPAGTPLDILDRRLASGELTVEEYRERRDALTRKDDPVGARS